MRKIKVMLSIGFPNAAHQEEIEVEDNATENEIWADVEAWANNYISYGWEESE